MTFTRLTLRSLAYYRRTHAAVALGVAGGVAVLAGSLIVGASVRQSLRSIATSRLGAVSVVVGAPQPFTDTLGARLGLQIDRAVAPMLALTGAALHESSSRRAGNVNVYGADARFFAFHGVTASAPARSDALVSADLARELGAADGDALIVRIARPTDIPIDSLHGRREDIGRSMRLTVRGTLAREHMGDFTLAPDQGPARAVFVPLARLQRDLGIEDRVNTLLVGGATDAAAVRGSLAAGLSAADLGLTVESVRDSATVVIESRSGLVPDAVADALSTIAAREGFTVTPVLTWLATRMTVGDRMVPYSLVSAVGPDAAGDGDVARLVAGTGDPQPAVLNEWAARELRATIGSALELEYLRWADEGRLVTDRATFRVAGVVPMRGAAVDARWAPDYPGITTATDVSDWDPPFPIDLTLVRPRDERYWDEYRTAPKAFIQIAAGQALWRTRHGQITSLRLRPKAPAPGQSGPIARESVAALRKAIERGINPLRAGFNVVDVRAQSLAASNGATDFGAYFSYFSFFLMVSALLLSALFFRLSIEQRLSQIGVLRAGGFSLVDIRRAFLIEGVAVAAAGAVLGTALAIGWAALMMLALRTWWVGAVGTTLLRLHVDPLSLVVGASATMLAAIVAIVWTIRTLSRTTPRAQLAGAGSEPVTPRVVRGRWLASGAMLMAALLSALSLTHVIPAAGGFFGAGALVLIGGLAAFRVWIDGARARGDTTGAAVGTIAALGLRNASWRPGRSLTVAGLVAAAVFLLVSVDSFRKTVGATGAASGTGGFALMAEAALPIVHDLQTREGRDAVGLVDASGGAALARAHIFSFRLRPGDDASCLNLYQPKQPRVLGVSERFINERRFRFAESADNSGADPWRLLGPAAADGAVPAIVDATSLQYVLHARVGDVITIDADSSRPVSLRIVASLADSVLQSEIMIAERAFQELYPAIAGYRFFLVGIDDTSMRAGDVAASLERALEPFGFDVQETTAKLEAFHRVENTYLSTFQALGGLGLVLGCLGLVAVVLRNVLERRRELALLGATGFTGADLQRVVAVEHVALVAAGLIVGVAASAIAVAPVVIARGGGAPWHALVWILPVAAAGLLAAFGATRGLRRLPLVESLRGE